MLLRCNLKCDGGDGFDLVLSRCNLNYDGDNGLDLEGDRIYCEFKHIRCITFLLLVCSL